MRFDVRLSIFRGGIQLTMSISNQRKVAAFFQFGQHSCHGIRTTYMLLRFGSVVTPDLLIAAVSSADRPHCSRRHLFGGQALSTAKQWNLF